MNWTTTINDLSQVATVYPQTAYTGLSKSLQHEWAYIQRVIPNIANELLPIQASITNTFLPSLFGHALQDDYVSAMTSFPVQLGGLSLPNPRTDSPYNYQSSLLLASHLIRSLRGQEDFSVMTHLAMRKSISIRRTADLAQRHLALICEITKDLPPLTKRILDRGQSTGHWLSVFPSTFTDTLISAAEFRDGLHLRYGITPTDLPKLCDGCQQPFSVTHSLQCKVGGLITRRHDEINATLGQLCVQALGKSTVFAEPRINYTRRTKTDDF